MSAMAFQITSLTIIYSTIYSRHRSKKTSKLHITGLCEGKSPGPVNSPHKGPVTRKMFPFDIALLRMHRFRYLHQQTGPWFNIKMPSYQYRKSHCGDKTVVRSSYLHNGISYTGKMPSLYWTKTQGVTNNIHRHRRVDTILISLYKHKEHIHTPGKWWVTTSMAKFGTSQGKR